MIDLVSEEERVAHLTGQGFEQLLESLDDESPADLCQRYDDLGDRYMVLNGKGRRSAEENLALDRLDSAFSTLLGEAGLLVQAGRLMALQHSAAGCAAVFRLAAAPDTALMQARMEFLKMRELVQRGGLKGPIPVPVDPILHLSARADRAAAALLDLKGAGSWWPPGSRSVRLRRGLNRLFDELGQLEAGDEAWQAAAELLRPDRLSASERVRRLKTCYRLAGVADCWSIAGKAREQVRSLAELVREGLSA